MEADEEMRKKKSLVVLSLVFTDVTEIYSQNGLIPNLKYSHRCTTNLIYTQLNCSSEYIFVFI